MEDPQPGGLPTRSEDTDYVTVRVRNRDDQVICTLYVGPERVIVGRNTRHPEQDTRWAHPHRVEARDEALSAEQRARMSFQDAPWNLQEDEEMAATRLRDLSQQIWRIGSGAAVYCTQGKHRSPSAIGAFLIDYFHYTPQEVEDLLKASFANREGRPPVWEKVRSILDGYYLYYKNERDAGTPF